MCTFYNYSLRVSIVFFPSEMTILFQGKISFATSLCFIKLLGICKRLWQEKNLKTRVKDFSDCRDLDLGYLCLSVA